MKKHLKLIVGLCAAVLGLVGLLMIFAPAITFEGMENPIKGSDIAFGGYDTGSGINSFAASAYILAFILPVLGVLFALLATFGKLGKAAPILAAICFVVGGVFFFLPKVLCMPNIPELVSAVPGFDKGEYISSFRESIAEYDLGAGAIVGGLFCILAACGSVATMFLGKKAD